MFRTRRRRSTATKPAVNSQPETTLIKVALVGSSRVGKTSLMVRYVEGAFDEHQLRTQGVNFMERVVSLQGHELTFSIWDIGGDEEFSPLLPLVCNDSVAIIFAVSSPSAPCVGQLAASMQRHTSRLTVRMFLGLAVRLDAA